MSPLALVSDFKQVVSFVFTSYCVICSSLGVGLTKCINSRSPSQIILQLFSVEKTKLYVYKVNVFIDGERWRLVENDVKKLVYCGFGLKVLIIQVLNRLPRHLRSNSQPFVCTAIRHVFVRKCLNIRQHGRLVVKNCESFCHYVGI